MADDRKAYLASFVGVYHFEHPGGAFEVHLRPDEKFFAPQFQAKATYAFDASGKVMTVEWGKYGVYVLELTDLATKSFSGSAKDKPESWRKMSIKRPFSMAEAKLMDSVWDFQHPGGSFEVEFRADAFNHFICNDFPAHSHWKISNGESPSPTIDIDWGKFGKYTLTIAADGESMSGSATGQPDNWRKAQRKSALGVVAEAHVHDH